MVVKLIEELDLLTLRTKGIKKMSLSDFASLIYSVDFYMKKNIEFDERIEELEDDISLYKHIYENI